jgi:phosphatidylglycerol---prolipoprotein diacylglyceryl transferase
MLQNLLAWITINPNPIVFKIPFIEHPIAWYGCIFAFAFYLGYNLFIWIYTRHLLDKVSITSEFEGTKIPESFTPSKKQKKLYHFYKARCQDEEKLQSLKLQFYLESTHPDKVTSIEKKSLKFSESALLYMIIGTVVGARLGHILFYENITEYILNPINIIKTWEGGLASHGGIIAIILASILFVRKEKSISFLAFADLATIPTMFVCAWIRIGNFINQEILGDVTTKPWGIIFKSPVDGGAILPRHPMQLYEFLLYLSVSALLFTLWYKKTYIKKTGLYIGIALTISFSVRFFLEFLKVPQSIYDADSFLQVGQLLSLPMIILGLVFVIFSRKEKVDLDKKLSEF